MKTGRIPRITRLWLAVTLVLAALPWTGTAAADAPVDVPLIEAAGRGNLELVKILLEKGVNVNAENDHGLTALMTASAQGHVEVAQLLVDRDADVDARDSAGETALMYAASKGFFEVVKLLVENGAGVAVEESSLVKAMAVARKNGHEKTVQFLKVRSYVLPRETWFGKVISSTPRALGVRVLFTEEVIMMRLGRSTRSSSLRSPPVGAAIEVLYTEAGGKVGYQMKILDGQ
jgi:hypothetical protein